jgi:hypothetical protein
MDCQPLVAVAERQTNTAQAPDRSPTQSRESRSLASTLYGQERNTRSEFQAEAGSTVKTLSVKRLPTRLSARRPLRHAGRVRHAGRGFRHRAARARDGTADIRRMSTARSRPRLSCSIRNSTRSPTTRRPPARTVAVSTLPEPRQGHHRADSGGSRPRFRDDLAHHSDLISLGVPR